jgi:hypothetical protein
MTDFPQKKTDRRGRPETVATDAAGAGAAAFARAGFSDPRLVLNWAEIAGEKIAAISLPLRLSGGVLTLKAEPSAAFFLQYETRTLAGRINTYLGRPLVKRLKFVQGTLTPRPPLPPCRKAAGEVTANDPVRRYRGPQALHEALVNLARTRHGRAIMRNP